MQFGKFIQSSICVAAIMTSLGLAACSGASAAQPTSTASPLSPSQTGLASPTPTSATPAALTPTAGLTPVALTSPTAGTTNNVTVSPREVNVGNVILDFSVEPAQHLFDAAAIASPIPGQPQDNSTGSKSQTTGSAVFGGGMVGTTNNIDPSQAPPADSAQSIIRHVVVHVRTKSNGQAVPYLGVTMDILLNGHPVAYDQALEPMVSVDNAKSKLYYGNNVQFPQAGTYQIFVRMQPSPMLGKGQPQAAQFNLIIH